MLLVSFSSRVTSGSAQRFCFHSCRRLHVPLLAKNIYPTLPFSRPSRSNFTHASLKNTDELGKGGVQLSPLSLLSETLNTQGFRARSNPKSRPTKSFFPHVSDRNVAIWLLGSAASVFGIVVFGGLTRLTESGYVSLLLMYFPNINIPKLKYYGMEACNRFSTATQRGRLGHGIQKVQSIA